MAVHSRASFLQHGGGVGQEIDVLGRVRAERREHVGQGQGHDQELPDPEMARGRAGRRNHEGRLLRHSGNQSTTIIQNVNWTARIVNHHNIDDSSELGVNDAIRQYIQNGRIEQMRTPLNIQRQQRIERLERQDRERERRRIQERQRLYRWAMMSEGV